MIPYGRQEISDKDIESVVKVLKSDFITQGPITIEFEKKVAKYCGAKYAHAVNSATSALHIACLSGVEGIFGLVHCCFFKLCTLLVQKLFHCIVRFI